jgi:hypothetical protein
MSIANTRARSWAHRRRRAAAKGAGSSSGGGGVAEGGGVRGGCLGPTKVTQSRLVSEDRQAVARGAVADSSAMNYAMME